MSDQPKKFRYKLPTDADLRKIPYWARVAYASRCAQRVLVLLQFEGPAAKQDQLRPVLVAIDFARRLASSPPGPDDSFPTHSALMAASEAFSAANALPSSTAQYAAYAAAAALEEAVGRYEHVGAEAAQAAQYAASAAAATSQDSVLVVLEEMRFDYQLLLWMTKRYDWTDETPVDFDFLGPFWTNNEPDWWMEERPSASEPPPTLHLEFSIPDGINKDEADRLISEIIQRSNELHHAMGGNGLKFEDGCVYESEPALVPAGEDDGGRGGWQ